MFTIITTTYVEVFFFRLASSFRVTRNEVKFSAKTKFKNHLM